MVIMGIKSLSPQASHENSAACTQKSQCFFVFILYFIFDIDFDLIFLYCSLGEGSKQKTAPCAAMRGWVLRSWWGPRGSAIWVKVLGRLFGWRKPSGSGNVRGVSTGAHRFA